MKTPYSEPKPTRWWEWAIAYPIFWMIMGVAWLADRIKPSH